MLAARLHAHYHRRVPFPPGARAALIHLIPALLWAQATPGTIAGRVTTRTDAGTAPAPGVTIAIAGTELRASTGADGRFEVRNVPPGAVVLRARLPGYRTVEREARVTSGDTTRVDIMLEAEAQLLAPVRSSAPATDVERFEAKPNVATVALTARSMAGVPRVGEPDVVRVAQLLPGVVARNDFNTGLNVRGGEADQNLVLLDGYPIYNPFHLGGLFSTFMDATVGGMELTTGAFPARYGGRLSSVLDVRSADEVRAGTHGTAEVSVLGASAKLGALFGEGRGTWSFAARRTYADAAMRIFTEDLFPYHFRDLHGRATYSLPRGVNVAVTAYAGRDVLDANFAEYATDSTPSRAGEGRWAFNWGNRVLGVKITKDVGANAIVEQRLSTSDFSTLLNLGDGALTQRNGIRDLTLAGSLHMHGGAHDLSAGYQLSSYRIRYASLSAATGTTEFDLVQQLLSPALWVSDLWRISPRWLLETGFRGEALTGREWASLSPRVSAKYFVTRDLAFTAAAGRVTQVTHSLAGDGPLRYFDIWIASDSFIPVAVAWHYVLGAQRRIGNAAWLQVESFVKRYDRVLEANWSEDPQRRGDEFVPVAGLSYGLDLLARLHESTRGLAGWIAYTYGVSSRSNDGARWAPGHDRRHDVNVVATWRVSKYRLGARLGYATGTPYTPIVGEVARRVYDPSRDQWGSGGATILRESLGGTRHGARFPPAQRLDLDASRDFQLRGVVLTPYASVANAYNAHNVFVYLYDYSKDGPTRRAISQFPIIPSVGVRVAF